MEHKPIKRNEHIKQLSREHHDGLLFCWKIRQGLKHEVAVDRILGYLWYFWESHLLPHFREEEDILFVPVSDDRVGRAIGEHRDIGDTIAALIAHPDRSPVSKLMLLANMVDNHIRYEERELFPHLESILSDEQLERIGVQLQAMQPPPDDYEDAFWIKD